MGKTHRGQGNAYKTLRRTVNRVVYHSGLPEALKTETLAAIKREKAAEEIARTLLNIQGEGGLLESDRAKILSALQNLKSEVTSKQ